MTVKFKIYSLTITKSQVQLNGLQLAPFLHHKVIDAH